MANHFEMTQQVFSLICTHPCRLNDKCHDKASRFVCLLAGGGREHLEFDDFLPLLQVAFAVVAVVISVVITGAAAAAVVYVAIVVATVMTIIFFVFPSYLEW